MEVPIYDAAGAGASHDKADFLIPCPRCGQMLTPGMMISDVQTLYTHKTAHGSKTYLASVCPCPISGVPDHYSSYRLHPCYCEVTMHEAAILVNTNSSIAVSCKNYAKSYVMFMRQTYDALRLSQNVFIGQEEAVNYWLVIVTDQLFRCGVSSAELTPCSYLLHSSVVAWAQEHGYKMPVGGSISVSGLSKSKVAGSISVSGPSKSKDEKWLLGLDETFFTALVLRCLGSQILAEAALKSLSLSNITPFGTVRTKMYIENAKDVRRGRVLLDDNTVPFLRAVLAIEVGSKTSVEVASPVPMPSPPLPVDRHVRKRRTIRKLEGEL